MSTLGERGRGGDAEEKGELCDGILRCLSCMQRNFFGARARVWVSYTHSRCCFFGGSSSACAWEIAPRRFVEKSMKTNGIVVIYYGLSFYIGGCGRGDANECVSQLCIQTRKYYINSGSGPNGIQRSLMYEYIYRI